MPFDRKEIKVHEKTAGIQITYDLKEQEILNVDESYVSSTFRKYKVDAIVYDDHVIACFYEYNNHPLSKLFSTSFLKLTKMYAQSRMTVILEKIEKNKAILVVFPSDKVKQFKDDI